MGLPSKHLAIKSNSQDIGGGSKSMWAYVEKERTYEIRPTYVLIALNLAVYLILAVMGGSFLSLSMDVLGTFGQFNLMVRRYGWWWQILTSMFVHVNLPHLLLNMFWLYILGRRSEFLFGKKLFLAVYLFSGITGNIMGLALPLYTVSAGASGAIFGIFGANIMVERAYSGSKLSSTLIYAFLILMINSLVGVNILAHLGGLLFGIAFGYWYGEKVMRRYSYREEWY
ncbi:MAG: rhomboid family intramembrane serine protease [Thermoproteota archaeon]|nr:MAG: rhomboid family intramembrane serine protease [Candidatus Korarchaeota archaeon]